MPTAKISAVITCRSFTRSRPRRFSRYPSRRTVAAASEEAPDRGESRRAGVRGPPVRGRPLARQGAGSYGADPGRQDDFFVPTQATTSPGNRPTGRHCAARRTAAPVVAARTRSASHRRRGRPLGRVRTRRRLEWRSAIRPLPAGALASRAGDRAKFQASRRLGYGRGVVRAVEIEVQPGRRCGHLRANVRLGENGRGPSGILAAAEGERGVAHSGGGALGADRPEVRGVRGGFFLFGLEEHWRSEGRTAFGCSCGEELTLNGHLEDEERKVRKIGGLPSGAGGGLEARNGGPLRAPYRLFIPVLARLSSERAYFITCERSECPISSASSLTWTGLACKSQVPNVRLRPWGFRSAFFSPLLRTHP